MNLDWLDDQLLGEPVRDWMMALAIAAAALLVLALVKRIVVSRVSRIAARTETQVDDFFVEMVRRTRWLLVLFPVLAMAAVSLDVPRLRGYLKTAAILAFLLQLALWALVAINFWMERKRRAGADAASVTMIRAFGFMGKVVLWSVILLLALENVGVDVTALIAGLGVGGVAVALALQNILGDLLASLSIVLDKPFVIGDTIQVDTFTGTVESIGIRTTHLRSVTGEQLVFSNGDLVRSRIRNHKRMGERRVAHAFDVVYQTPAEKLAQIPEIVRGLVDGREQVRFDHAHLTGLGESGIRFEAVWFVLSPDMTLHQNLQQEILLDLLRRFEAEGIELAYPTRSLMIHKRSKGASVRKSLGFLLLLLLVSGAASAQIGAQAHEGMRLLHYPDIQGDTIVFVYAGDLWTVGAEGGEARRLTSDPGLEQFPKFSPDGKWIAFTGQYSGTYQVHVIPADGSASPKQLTFRNDIGALPPRGGVDNQVFGWTPDSKQVLFKANRVPWSERIGRPYLVPVAGGMERPLQVPESGTGTLSPDGTKLVYTPVMREFRTWKRHKGGRAQDVWIYDLKNDTSEQLTDFVGTDNMPVWIGNTIYFTSDRGGWQLNLFAYDLGTRQTRQVTNHDQFDVLWPSGDERRIVYQQAGYLHVFDTASGQTRQVPIQVHGDFPGTLPYFKNVTADAQSMAVSPTGKRAVLGARGEIFTVPAQKGEIRNLTSTPGIREMDAVWSPDGRRIAYLSDRSGEYEVYVRPSDGSGEERRVTTGGKVWRFPPLWSPDSRKIAFGDSDQHLFWVDVQSGKTTEVDHSDRDDLDDYRWSPDSRWLTYTKEGETQLDSVWVYSLEDRKATRLTSDLTDEAEPVFSPDGRYLYFLSNRDYNLTFSGFEFSYVYTNPTRVYVAVLSKEGPALFLPTSDEEEFTEDEGNKPGSQQSKKPPKPMVSDAADTAEEPKGGGDAEAGEGKDSAPAKAVRVKIDADGFEHRVRAIPGPPGNYRALQASSDGVFYLLGDGPQAALKMFDLKAEKEQTVLEGVGGYDLSADGKKVLYRQGDNYGIVDAKPGQKMGDGKLALEKMELRIEPREEWRQMYVDAWRILRDWFYDPNMHGLNWEEIRDRYGALVPYVARAEDLDWILGEVGSELSSGHVYLQPGERPGVERVENGLLGAEVELHPSGYYRVTKVFPGENWHQDFRSPLTEPGVNVPEGSYILSVDGTSTKGVDNFYRLLQNKADRVVTLLVNDKPDAKGAWVERVRPVKSEQNLRYLDWVLATREKVAKASGGRIGYIHLPNTAVEGNRELFKYFYPQTNTDALILDDRYNGGGFVPDEMIELVSRPLLHYWIRRGEQPERVPEFVHTGPKVTLINGQAGSGGDAFPYYFKELGLGPLIGTRTWGGLIGLSGNPPLVDGTELTTPTFRFLDTEGNWGIENEGVAPDIEVIDRPDQVAKGQDPSLEKAIQLLLEELRKNPPAKLKVPKPPVQEWPPK